MTRSGNIPLVDPDRSTACVPAPAHRVPPGHAFSGRAGLSSLARAGFALLLANVRYWSTVAPRTRVQLARWEQAASSIPDPALRALAGRKLRDEHFNAQVAATLATLAPRVHRARVVEAIVALQVMYDYLDVLSEQPATAPPTDGRLLFTALHDAVALPIEDEEDPGADRARDYYGERAHADDGGYLQALVETVRAAFATLPTRSSIADVAQRSATRCAEAQILNHRASGTGIEEARDWATVQASGTGLGWQELLAGATASVLGIHALIATAADAHTTPADAEALDALYLSIGALTMLDSLVDQEEDVAAGQLGYLHYYDSPEKMAAALVGVARDAVARARALPNGAHHIVTLAGIVAYYASAPAASEASARPVISRVRRELRPLITPTLALMRAWRLAKRVRDRGRHGADHV